MRIIVYQHICVDYTKQFVDIPTMQRINRIWQLICRRIPFNIPLNSSEWKNFEQLTLSQLQNKLQAVVNLASLFMKAITVSLIQFFNVRSKAISITQFEKVVCRTIIRQLQSSF